MLALLLPAHVQLSYDNQAPEHDSDYVCDDVGDVFFVAFAVHCVACALVLQLRADLNGHCSWPMIQLHRMSCTTNCPFDFHATHFL